MEDAIREQVTLTFEVDGCVMGYWGDIAIVVWSTQATIEHAQAFGRLADEMVRKHPRVSTVQVLAPGSTVPTPAARAVINELIILHAKRLIGCAAVLEGSGFWASTMRSFLTGLQLFQRSGFTTKICGTPEEAAAWLAELHTRQGGRELNAAELLVALTELRTRPAVDRSS